MNKKPRSTFGQFNLDVLTEQSSRTISHYVEINVSALVEDDPKILLDVCTHNKKKIKEMRRLLTLAAWKTRYAEQEARKKLNIENL